MICRVFTITICVLVLVYGYPISKKYRQYKTLNKYKELIQDFSISLEIDEYLKNPEESEDLFEGDILEDNSKNGIKNESFRWPNAIIPYVIEDTFKKVEQEILLLAIGAYHDNTCIRFREKDEDDIDYIIFQNERPGCFSNIGKIGGPQVVNLYIGCFVKFGTVVHEMMHAVGFNHEQSRYDRNKYITILWNNIKKKHHKNFKMWKLEIGTGLGYPYDYDSVMHYPSRAFSKNNYATIIPKGLGNIGQRIYFSETDIGKINAMYNCDNYI